MGQRSKLGTRFLLIFSLALKESPLLLLFLLSHAFVNPNWEINPYLEDDSKEGLIFFQRVRDNTKKRKNYEKINANPFGGENVGNI